MRLTRLPIEITTLFYLLMYVPYMMITRALSTTPNEELGRPLGRNLPISFTGTLVDLRYDAESKPRKLTIQVKADTMELITDKTPAS